MKDELFQQMKFQYMRGFEDGLRAYAHWKNGVQYVGTMGKTLEKALAEIEDTWNFMLPLMVSENKQDSES